MLVHCYPSSPTTGTVSFSFSKSEMRFYICAVWCVHSDRDTGPSVLSPINPRRLGLDLTYILLVLVELRASTTERQRTRFWKIFGDGAPNKRRLGNVQKIPYPRGLQQNNPGSGNQTFAPVLALDHKSNSLPLGYRACLNC